MVSVSRDAVPLPIEMSCTPCRRAERGQRAQRPVPVLARLVRIDGRGRRAACPCRRRRPPSRRSGCPGPAPSSRAGRRGPRAAGRAAIRTEPGGPYCCTICCWPPRPASARRWAWIRGFGPGSKLRSSTAREAARHRGDLPPRAAQGLGRRAEHAGPSVQETSGGLVSIGNGTASRETDALVGDLMSRHPDLRLTRMVVSEAGASVYSASALAAENFLRSTCRCAARCRSRGVCRIRWRSSFASTRRRSVSASISTT